MYIYNRVQIDKCKDLQDKNMQIEELNSQVNIQTLVKERDELKDLYLEQWKYNNQSRVVLESQRRKLNSN